MEGFPKRSFWSAYGEEMAILSIPALHKDRDGGFR